MTNHTASVHCRNVVPKIKCNLCDFNAKLSSDLKQHTQINHMTNLVDVKINNTRSSEIRIACSLCEYTCRFNVQMKKHMKSTHVSAESKYECKFCPFNSNVLVLMYEHKLSVHPNIDTDFNPKSMNTKDFVMNIIAEQNMEIIEELLKLKNDLKRSFEELGGDLEVKINNAKNEVLKSNLLFYCTWCPNKEH